LAWFYCATLKNLEFVLLDSRKIPASSIDLKRWFQYVPDPLRALENGSKIVVQKGACEAKENEFQPNLFGNLWVRSPWAIEWLRRFCAGFALQHPGENIPALAAAELIGPGSQILLRNSLIDYGLPKLLALGSVNDIPKYDVGMHCLTTAEYNVGRNHSPRQFMELRQRLGVNTVYEVPGQGGRTADQILEEIAQCDSWIGGDTGFTHAYALLHPGRKLIAIYGPDDHCKEQFLHEALPIGFSRLRPKKITWSSDPIRFPADTPPKIVMQHNRFDIETVKDSFKSHLPSIKMPGKKDLHFLHSGDIGDIIAGLPVMKAAGGGRLFLTTSKETPKTGYDRLRMLIPLLAAQPYLKSVALHRGEPIDVDFTTHRSTGVTYGNLCVNQAAWAGVDTDRFSPWLEKPECTDTGLIVICRSGRHHGRLNWQSIVEHFKDKLIFMGLEEEHQKFCKHYGQVCFFKPPDFLKAARFIAGSHAVISNQTSFWWIAEGMKHKRVLEKRMAAPDDSEIDCPNAWHTFGPVNINELEEFIYG
jgi:hypothetical protein